MPRFNMGLEFSLLEAECFVGISLAGLRVGAWGIWVERNLHCVVGASNLVGCASGAAGCRRC